MHIALKLSKRLIGVAKVKNVLHIEAGLEMIALAMAISSEVSLALFFFAYSCFPNKFSHQNNGVFPELASEMGGVLKR
jgi:hypothetical protein